VSGSSPDGERRNLLLAAVTSDLGAAPNEDLSQVDDLFPLLDNFDSVVDSSWQSVIESGAPSELPPSVSTPLPLQSLESSMPYVVSIEECTPQRTLTSGSHATDLVPNGRNYLADPYANQLRLHIITLGHACMYNAIHLGIHNLQCCDDAISPLFNPRSGPSDQPQALAQSLQQTFSHIKPDLRPTISQVTIPHHPCIDVFPFSEVRSRVIELTTCDSPLIDEDAFWADCFNEGIVCWGSISPRTGVAPFGGGAPWDSRSWEAKKWFLTKWSFVVGGNEGKLARTSAWWRDMRGVGQGFSL